MINDAMFRRNGKAGYVLKPQALREAHKDALNHRTKHRLRVRVISAQQLPRARDSQGREVVDKSVLDPYVEVSLLVPDWTHSPFLPSGNDAKYTPASGPQVGGATSARVVTHKTKVVKNNGFNPVWDESLTLPFDCVGDMKDLVFIKFAVREGGQDSDEPLAQYIVPLGCLRQGKFLARYTPKPIALIFDFQVIAIFPCTTRNCRTSCSRPCSSIPRSPMWLNLPSSLSSLPLVDLACVPCCVLKPSSAVLYYIVSRSPWFNSLGNVLFVRLSMLIPYFYWPLHNHYPLIPPQCILTTTGNHGLWVPTYFFFPVSPHLSFWFYPFYLFGPRRRVLL